MTDFNIRITSEASGNRIDLFLTQKISQFSRSKIQKYIKNGDILVNKKKVKPNWILKKGEYVTGDIQLDITHNSCLLISVLTYLTHIKHV